MKDWRDWAVRVTEPSNSVRAETLDNIQVESSGTDAAPLRRLPGRKAALIGAGALAIVALGLLVLLGVLLGEEPDATVVTDGIEAERVIEGPGVGETPRFERPGGVAFGPDGRIYVADTGNSRIAVFSPSGRFEREFGGMGVAKPIEGFSATWEPGRLNYPVDVDVAENGEVYVADFYNDSISVFDADGEFLYRFPDPFEPVGRGGSGRDGRGIAVTSVAAIGGKVYATDTYQILVFSEEGELLLQFGRPGPDPEGLDHPNGIAVDSVGRIFVSDSNNNRVTAFSAEGEVLWTRGQRLSDLQSETNEAFVLPRGLTVERGGGLLVADTLGQQLVRLGQDGSVLSTYGVRGGAPGQLNFPSDVAVRGERVIVADRANDRVQVVRLTRR